MSVLASESSARDEERRQQQTFRQITLAAVIFAGLGAFIYLGLYLAAPDRRALPALVVNLAFGLAVAWARARIKNRTLAAYVIFGLMFLVLIGVAATVSGLTAWLSAMAFLPPAFIGLTAGARRIVPGFVMSFAVALILALINGTATWERIGLTDYPVALVSFHVITVGALVAPSVQLFRSLDQAIHHARASARQLRLLYDTSRLFGSTLTLDKLLPAVANHLARIIDAAGCFVALRDPATGELVPTAADSAHHAAYRHIRIRPGEPTLATVVCERREPVVVEDVHLSPHVNPHVAAQFHTRSLLGLPLIHHDEVLGAVMISETRYQRHFTSEEITRVQGLVQQVAAEIANAQLFEQTRRRSDDLEFLYWMAGATAATLDAEHVMRQVADGLMRSLGIDGCAFSRWDRDKHCVITIGDYRLTDNRTIVFPGDLGHAYNLDQYPVTLFYLQTQSIGQYGMDTPDMPPEEIEILRQLGFASMLFVPLVAPSGVFGMIELYARATRTFSEEEMARAMAVANLTATALERARLVEAERHSRRVTESLLDVAHAIGNQLDLDKLLGLILDQLRSLIPYKRGSIALLDAATGHFTPRASFGLSQAVLDHPPSLDPAIMPTSDRLVTTRRPYRIADTRTHSERQRMPGADDVLSWLGVPLVRSDQVIGFLMLDHSEPGFFTEEHERLAEAFAHHAAIAVDNAQLYQAAKHSLSNLNLLHNIAITVASSASLPEAMQHTVEAIQADLGQPYAVLQLLDSATSELAVRAMIGYPDSTRNLRIKVGQGITGWVAQTGQPALIPDTRLDPRFIDGSPDHAIRSELAVPLIAESEVLGVINVESTEPGAFDEGDLKLLSTLSGNLAMILRNLQLLDDLRDANVRLRELDQMKSHFLANVSHELRTPLNAIIGFAEILIDGLIGPLGADQREFVSNIHASGKHLLKLINDVLDLSKIQSGKLTIEMRPTNPYDVIRETCTVIAPLVAKKNQDLVLKLASGLPSVVADPLRLKQILINLLSNAHKFSPEGSCITLSAQSLGDAIRFGVTDQGDGIRPDQHELVFQEFAQLDDDPTHPHEGTGLGLSITRRLVEMHGGHIWIESSGTPGWGATFHFLIPAQLPAEPVAAPASETERRPVLIIENDPHFSNLLALYLSQQGYQPIQCFNIQTITSTLREIHPVLITLDLMMPDRTGWSVLRELKSVPDTRDVPIIVISALKAPDTGLEPGIEYLTKPFHLKDLQAVLRRVDPALRPERPRVLIVDDDALVNQLLDTMLPKNEYAVTTVSRGSDALDRIRRDPPDVVILDLLMPEMSGYQLLHLLRSDPATRDLPVIVLTAKHIGAEEHIRLSEAAQIVVRKADLTRQRLIDALRQLHLPARPEPNEVTA